MPKKIQIINFLKGELKRGSYDIDDIVMMTTIKDDNTIIKRVFRMNFISRKYSILTITSRKRQMLNNM